jgi:hypothetical protein
MRRLLWIVLAAGCGGGSPGGDGGAPPDLAHAAGDGGGGVCPAGDFLAALGKSHLLAGASMEDAVAKQAPFDLRYLYISGGLFDGNSPCANCASGCTAGGASCANANPNGCAWWGCWQYDQVPPGQYLRDFAKKASGDGQIPMVTYYQILQASGVQEGAP